MSASIEALYKNARAVLWVEDPETRAWLEALWYGAVPRILVLIAGGRSNVQAVCHQAVDAGPGSTHVFGLVDQDFGTTNRSRWGSLTNRERVYRLDVHEVENLLLDGAALAGCRNNTGKRTEIDIEARLLRAAQDRAWWMACIEVLANTREQAQEGYPPDPGAIGSLADAEQHIANSIWFKSTAARCRALADPATVQAALQAAHLNAVATLADGTWRRRFPGKQLFRAVSGYVHQNGGAGARIDLVKAVGEWQRSQGRVPPQVPDLRQAIVSRIGP